MTEQIIMAGFGGQGVLSIGKILAKAALYEGKNVSWLPSYGPEMRGGTASCSVIISEDEIGAPNVTDATAVLVLNRPSFEKFEKDVIPGGALIVNSSLISNKASREDINPYYIPASEIANEIGNSRATNMVILGAYLEIVQVVDKNTVINVITETFKNKNPKLTELNKKALTIGGDWAKEHVGDIV